MASSTTDGRHRNFVQNMTAQFTYHKQRLLSPSKPLPWVRPNARCVHAQPMRLAPPSHGVTHPLPHHTQQLSDASPCSCNWGGGGGSHAWCAAVHQHACMAEHGSSYIDMSAVLGVRTTMITQWLVSMWAKARCCAGIVLSQCP